MKFKINVELTKCLMDTQFLSECEILVITLFNKYRFMYNYNRTQYYSNNRFKSTTTILTRIPHKKSAHSTSKCTTLSSETNSWSDHCRKQEHLNTSDLKQYNL